MDYLKDYVLKLAPVIDTFFAKRQKEAKEISPEIVKMLQIYHQLLQGGKKLRGALIKLGYECAGGQERLEIIKASLSLEIIHAFLLIHDDVIDQDELRRGKPTVHKQYEALCKKRGKNKKRAVAHFGTSMAINTGDVGSFLGHLALLEAGFPDQRQVRALAELDRILLQVGYGQTLDVIYEDKQSVTEKDVLRVHRLKTGVYTGSGPLAIGAILAGVEKPYLESLQKFGLPVGIAFQIRDDEIGLFFEAGKIGKPTGSDIRENKNTLLKVKALELASPSDQEFLRQVYGNHNLSRAEILKVRVITKKSGAYDYSHQSGLKLIEKAKKHIPKITKDREQQSLLAKAADFMMAREK